MKIQAVITIVASLVAANIAVGDDRHDADRALETNLRQAINQKHVDIDVHDSIVKIEGEVRTEQDRQAIDALVRGTPGVAAVKDNLKVKFPSPGTSTYAPSIPPTSPGAVVTTTTTIPVYTKPAPEVRVPRVVTVAPVVVPDYPKLKVQAWTENDSSLANRIARDLRHERLPATGFDNVTITVREGTVILQGAVESSQSRDALLAALQSTGGMSAIYDQLQVR